MLAVLAPLVLAAYYAGRRNKIYKIYGNEEISKSSNYIIHWHEIQLGTDEIIIMEYFSVEILEVFSIVFAFTTFKYRQAKLLNKVYSQFVFGAVHRIHSPSKGGGGRTNALVFAQKH